MFGLTLPGLLTKLLLSGQDVRSQQEVLTVALLAVCLFVSFHVYLKKNNLLFCFVLSSCINCYLDWACGVKSEHSILH